MSEPKKVQGNQITSSVVHQNDEGVPFWAEFRDQEGYLCGILRSDGCLNLWILDSWEDGKEAWTKEGKQRAYNGEDGKYIHLCNPFATLTDLGNGLLMARELLNTNWHGE